MPSRHERRKVSVEFLLALHLDEGIEHHRAAFVGVDLERVEMRVLAAVGIVAIDLEFFDVARALGLVDRAALLDAAVLGQTKFGHIAGSLCNRGLRSPIEPPRQEGVRRDKRESGGGRAPKGLGGANQ